MDWNPSGRAVRDFGRARDRRRSVCQSRDLSLVLLASTHQSLGTVTPKKARRGPVSDRIPILGWFGLRREASIHGSGFWVRPILIEIGVAISLPLIYWFETQSGLLLPAAIRAPSLIAKF